MKTNIYLLWKTMKKKKYSMLYAILYALKEYENKYQTNIIALEEYYKYICCGR